MFLEKQLHHHEIQRVFKHTLIETEKAIVRDLYAPGSKASLMNNQLVSPEKQIELARLSRERFNLKNPEEQ